YEAAMDFILQKDPQAKVVSTQPFICVLYVKNKKAVIPCPTEKIGINIIALYKRGFRYLIVDPQAYVSWTRTGSRFENELNGFLNFTLKKVKPLKVFPNLNSVMRQRFVFEHTEN